MAYGSLEEKLNAVGSAVEMARNSQIGPYVYPAVAAEFSNWRDEQVAWRETCALFDQSHHMTDLYIEGPDVIRLLSAVGVNTFENFKVNKAKQFVVCNPDGYVIGDGILFFLDENRVSLVGRPSAHNWVQYHAETGGYDVTLERDERTAANPTGRRKIYRFQVQGPTAMQTLEKAAGGALPEIKFFNMGEITIAGRKVRALHHGMSGVPGLELFGPWEDSEDVRGAIVEAGSDFGLRQVGLAGLRDEHARVRLDPLPAACRLHRRRDEGLPRVAPGQRLRGARARSAAAIYSDEIEDYYLTPHDLGYWPFVKFDHDFVGREALEAMGDEPAREKVTLAWNGEDVARRWARCSRRATPRSTSTCRSPTTRPGRTTSCSSTATRSASRRSPATATTSARCSRSAIVNSDVEIGTEVVARLGRGGRRLGEARRRAARAGRDPCGRQPLPVLGGRATSYADGWRTKAAAS